MARKQTTNQTTAAGAAPARAVTPVIIPKTARVTNAKHSKAVTVIPSEPDREEIPSPGNAIDIISKLAYGYWESRGCKGGDSLSDWVRAEEEYRRSL